MILILYKKFLPVPVAVNEEALANCGLWSQKQKIYKFIDGEWDKGVIYYRMLWDEDRFR